MVLSASSDTLIMQIYYSQYSRIINIFGKTVATWLPGLKRRVGIGML
jgi:hypothetical protein